MTAYLEILRLPKIAALFAAALVSRLPVAVNGLAVVLFLREQTGSFSVGGAVAGGLALGTGIGAPLMGRLVDRQGTRVIVPVALANAASLLALVALGASGMPAPVLVGTAVASGALFPPLGSVLRARFPDLLRDAPHLVPSAYALDSVLLELGFVAEPLVTAALVALAEPAAPLLFSALFVVAGAVAFTALAPPRPDAVRDEHAAPGMLGPLRAPGIRTLVLTMVPVGFGIGAFEVALPAFGDARAAPEVAGVLLAVWSIGSAGNLEGVRHLYVRRPPGEMGVRGRYHPMARDAART